MLAFHPIKNDFLLIYLKYALLLSKKRKIRVKKFSWSSDINPTVKHHGKIPTFSDFKSELEVKIVYFHGLSRINT